MVDQVDMRVEQLKRRLRTYSVDDILYNEPHVTMRLIERSGRRDELVNNLLNPDNLVFYRTDVGIYGDTVHTFYFRIAEKETLLMPVIFDRGGKKCLYILTYIMRLRSWHTMI